MIVLLAQVPRLSQLKNRGIHDPPLSPQHQLDLQNKVRQVLYTQDRVINNVSL